MTKYCPYLDSVKTTVEQFVYDEHGRVTQKITIEKATQAQCTKSACTAYIDSECRFSMQEVFDDLEEGY